MSYKLGILEQSPIYPGTTAVEAFEKTVRFVKNAEAWGYDRFWVGEHHHMKEVAGSSPEVLVSYLLAQTNSIHIGSGGVMLQHYSPYKVAENFHVLSTLAPGRVDLGIGKAPGGYPLSTKALQFGTMNDGGDFAERLGLLQKIIEDSVDQDHPIAGIQATPIPPIRPEIFLLGASPSSASLAAENGLSYVFAQFLNYNHPALEEASTIYRSKCPDGRFIASVAVLAADTQQEAEELAKDHKLFKIHLKSGKTLTVQSPKQALAFEEQAGEPFEIEEQKTHVIAGTPDYVKGKLEHLHKTYQVDEFILHTPILKEAERIRSFELLSPFYSDETTTSNVNNGEFIA